MFHKDHPWGKGLWIWRINECLDGNIDTIIRKCQDFDIPYLLIKNGDGGNLWTQLNKDVVAKFQNAGIKIYSWTYNYGDDPIAESLVAIKCLDLGVSGHVFDAEAEYRDAPNNVQAAETMLQAVRAKYPNTFLAHAPLAIIDYHTKFPYATFGKYCDAVMPQVYYGTMKRTPQQAVAWMYDNFSRWEKSLRANGLGDAVKPIIPIGQTYDNYTIAPPYITTPADIHAFVSETKGYKSVSFWSFQHIIRDDCWAAIRDAKVDAPTDEELGIVRPAVQPAEEPSAPSVQEAAPQEHPDVTVLEAPVIVPEQSSETQHVTPQDKPQRIEMPTNVSIPVSSQPTTVTFKPNKNDPEKMDVIVHGQKTHREYVVEFLQTLIAAILSLLQARK